MLKYLLAISFVVIGANAEEIISTMSSPDDETIVYGEAQNPNGTFNEVLLEQPKNAPNPLGDPIPDYVSSQPLRRGQKSEVTPKIPDTVTLPNAVEEISPQNPKISEMSPQEMNNEIQNKLYEEGNRVYDVQSYPIKDINELGENGQDNAITNYPAY